MNDDQLRAWGREIERVRTLPPKITVERIAEEAGIAPNTVSAVQRGEAVEGSLEKVVAAMARLGRPVEVVSEPAPQSVDYTPHPAELMGDLVTTLLRATPPEEYEELERNLWLLLRGRHAELRSRLSKDGP